MGGSDIDGESEYDQSGGSVSLSDDGLKVAIGARYNGYNDGNGYYSGHVRVYEWKSGPGEWTQMGSDIDGESECDLFGGSVSLSYDGLKVAIGASDGNGYYSGHVRVYEWKSGPGEWTQ